MGLLLLMRSSGSLWNVAKQFLGSSQGSQSLCSSLLFSLHMEFIADSATYRKIALGCRMSSSRSAEFL